MTRIIKETKGYTLADMVPTSPRHENHQTVTLYDQNGLEVVLQGNINGGQRIPGRSPMHHHSHDELVYIVQGHYLQSEGIEQFAPNFLRIPAGLEHGGISDGVWISVKPKDFKLVEGEPGAGYLLYRGRRHVRLCYDMRGTRIMPGEILKAEVSGNSGPRKLKINIPGTSGRIDVVEIWL